jgi:hypothetical protein
MAMAVCVKLARVAVCLLTFLAVVAPVVAQGTPSDTQAKLKQTMVETARKTYEGAMSRLKFGLPNNAPGFEDFYRWSRRWLEAQVDLASTKDARVAAYQEHVDRMRKLEQLAKGLKKSGTGLPADVSATGYYRSQAELWLEQAKVR